MVTAGWVSVNRFGLALDGVSDFRLFGMGGKMASFGIFWFGGAKGGGGGWMGESFMPVSL
jgi:hypothetical protein